jgi:hypothetical protein
VKEVVGKKKGIRTVGERRREMDSCLSENDDNRFLFVSLSLTLDLSPFFFEKIRRSLYVKRNSSCQIKCL